MNAGGTRPAWLDTDNERYFCLSRHYIPWLSTCMNTGGESVQKRQLLSCCKSLNKLAAKGKAPGRSAARAGMAECWQ
jgi:hypothetical protein